MIFNYTVQIDGDAVVTTTATTVILNVLTGSHSWTITVFSVVAFLIFRRQIMGSTLLLPLLFFPFLSARLLHLIFLLIRLVFQQPLILIILQQGIKIILFI